MLIGKKKSPIKVLFVSTEVKPFAMAGGLGSYMNSLPLALREEGVDVRAMIPRYLSVDDKKWDLKMVHKGLKVPTDNQNAAKHLICNVKMFDGTAKTNSFPVYFLENLEYYEQRANIYGYADDPVRWALLSRGIIEFLLVSDWKPDVIMCCDWMLGMLPNYLKTKYADEKKLKNIKTVFSIHNLAHQGMFNHRFVSDTDYDDGHSEIPAFEDPRLLKLNGARRGIMYADLVQTVSPTYAKEILTEEQGDQLDALLRERRSDLVGILNGINYASWNPKKDPIIPHHFSASSLRERAKNKAALQETFGLPVSETAFLIGVSSRIVAQKGFILLQNIIEPLLNELDLQFVLVGEGSPGLMEFFSNLQKKFPEKVSVNLHFDPNLPRLIFAGADVTLIPSKYEPSGLTQMEAMGYGTVPIARKTGGLADSIEDYNAETDEGTGFLFEKFDPFPLVVAIVRAYETFRHKDLWKNLQVRAMKKDFSWNKSAKKYIELFDRAMTLKKKDS